MEQTQEISSHRFSHQCSILKRNGADTVQPEDTAIRYGTQQVFIVIHPAPSLTQLRIGGFPLVEVASPIA